MTDTVKYHQLRDRDTGATIHPETSARQVLMPGDTNLHEAFTALTGTVSGKQDALASSPDVTISAPDGDPPQLGLTDRARRALFDDLFLAAGGTWARIDHTHTNPDGTPSPYYLNELWLTYPEAVAVYQAGAIDTQYCELRYYGLDIRTNLPPVCSSWASGSTATKYQLAEFIRNSNIEILNLSSRRYRFCIEAGGIGHVTFIADKLRKIIGGGIDIGCYTGKNNHRLFGSCPELTEVEIFNLHSDLNLSGLPKLNAASVRTLIERKYNIGSEATAAYTVTLHADVYNKIVEAADIADGDKLSAWSGLLELAASKNITFASA